MGEAEVVTIDADNGIAVVRKRQNRHLLSSDWQQVLSIKDPMSILTMKQLQENREHLLRLMSWDEFRTWIQQSAAEDSR